MMIRPPLAAMTALMLAGCMQTLSQEEQYQRAKAAYEPVLEVERRIAARDAERADAQKINCERIGGVSVGMSRAQVYATCWGKPEKINSTIGSYGTHEQLVYPGGNYLYLENGVLRSIQTSR